MPRWTDRSWEESDRFVRECEAQTEDEIAECKQCKKCPRKERVDEDEYG